MIRSQIPVANAWVSLRGFVLVLGALGVGVAPAGAGVQIAPGGAIIFVSSESKAGGKTDTHSASAPGIADWSATVNSVAEDDANGVYVSGQTSLVTGFTPDNFAASSNGEGTVSGGAGTVAGGALVAVFFAVDTVQIYFANSYMYPGSYANRLNAFVANLNTGETPVIPLVAGSGLTNVSGRLPPGVYVFYMQNSFGPESDTGDETTFSTGVSFITCANPLINRQPTNQTVHIHHTALFSVGTSGPAANGTAGANAAAIAALTFQWRKGLQNLSDGGRISGTQTSQLTITDAAVSDSGLYDCVVTQGADVEPSSLVHLTVDESTTDVPAMRASTGLEMAPPSPSPFGARTQVRFSLPRAAETSLEVLDVNGRRVRCLLPRGAMEAGARTVTWDGRDERGERTSAGIYFLRLTAGSEQVVRRVVSLGGSR